MGELPEDVKRCLCECACAADVAERACCYAHEVIPAMDELRARVDAMEDVVARAYWPVPTYDDILFYV